MQNRESHDNIFQGKFLKTAYFHLHACTLQFTIAHLSELCPVASLIESTADNLTFLLSLTQVLVWFNPDLNFSSGLRLIFQCFIRYSHLVPVTLCSHKSRIHSSQSEYLLLSLLGHC